MARATAVSKKSSSSRIVHEVEATLCAAAGAVLLLSFLSFVPDSPGINSVGPAGYAVANLFIQCFGVAAYIFPGLLMATAAVLFSNRSAQLSAVRATGGLFTLLIASVALGLYRPHVSADAAGGWIGGFLATLMEQNVGHGGSSVILFASTLLVFMMLTGRALSEVVRGIVGAIRNAIRSIGEGIQRMARRASLRASELWAAARQARSRVRRPVARAARPEADDAPVVLGLPEEQEPTPHGDPEIVVERPMLDRPRGKKSGKTPKEEQEEFIFEMDTSNFRLPPTSLLGSHDDRSDYVPEATLVSQSKILEQKLSTFGVNGRVTAVRPGPVITTYEFEPESGVKVARVVNLCDDLTMAMRAHGVRIVAPIPGKNVVGIEVSNRKSAIVGLRDLIEADDYRESRSPLTLALGRDTNGLPACADLAKMPHLLMAGATGTGKSVALNAYIVSILYKATPADVRFIMIDPKMLELSLYEGIPHLLVPVVTDVKKAKAAFTNVMREMERRFALLKDKRVRNLDDYNRRIAEEPPPERPPVEEGEGVSLIEGAPLVHEHLPRIVVVVDELADLLIAVGREIEEPITRLAQKARAAGIHLILATQRPSVDVITGLIKANFPSRISFQVTSRPDSRTILDSIGAERLLGNGDLLYMAPGTSFLKRLHGGYITDREANDVADFLKKQGDPDYKMEMLELPDADGPDGDGEEFFDELYDRAVDVVTQHGQGSTSWLQRKLGIGYNRAARIMEHMEREGVVGPGDGSRPRQVLARAIDSNEAI